MYDTFREQIAAVLVEWLLDLTRSRLGTDTLVLREIIAVELLAPRRREGNSFTSWRIYVIRRGWIGCSCIIRSCGRSRV